VPTPSSISASSAAKRSACLGIPLPLAGYLRARFNRRVAHPTNFRLAVLRHVSTARHPSRQRQGNWSDLSVFAGQLVDPVRSRRGARRQRSMTLSCDPACSPGHRVRSGPATASRGRIGAVRPPCAESSGKPLADQSQAAIDLGEHPAAKPLLLATGRQSVERCAAPGRSRAQDLPPPRHRSANASRTCSTSAATAVDWVSIRCGCRRASVAVRSSKCRAPRE